MLLEKYFFKVMLLTSILCFANCRIDEAANVEGRLIYTNGGSRIHELTLGDSGEKLSTIYKSKGISSINHITNISNDIILFGECAVTGECNLKILSLDIGQVTLLCSGTLPNYIANHNKIFFYDKANDGDDWLFVADLKDVNDRIKIAKAPKWKILPNGISQPVISAVVEISSNEVIFVGREYKLWLCNVATTKLTSMHVKNCHPILWRSKKNQLLCMDWNTLVPFLLDINTEKQISIPQLKEAYGFVYLPKIDALIYGRTRPSFLSGEAYDIFLYSFIQNEEKRIRKNLHIAGGVWMEIQD